MTARMTKSHFARHGKPLRRELLYLKKRMDSLELECKLQSSGAIPADSGSPAKRVKTTVWCTDSSMTRKTIAGHQMKDVTYVDMPAERYIYPKPFFRGSLKEAIAKHITAIVGLREALSWDDRRLRWFWTACLITGITLTCSFVVSAVTEYVGDPTAAKLDLEKSHSYPYPPLFLCPEPWLDTEKALAMGLSLAALQYSLGYYAVPVAKNRHLENVSEAHNEFLDFYKNNNFTSLDDYFKAIAIDFEAVSSMNAPISSRNGSVYCEESKGEHEPLEKVLFNERVCYLFRKKPAKNEKALTLDFTTFWLLIPDRSRGHRDVETSWPLHVGQQHRMSLKSSPTPPLYLPPQTWNFIWITEERFRSLETGKTSCIKSNETYSYSAHVCYAICMSEKTAQYLGCTLFSQAPSNITYNRSPLDYCNNYNKSLDTWRDHPDYPEYSETCGKLCPPSCDKTVFDIMVRSQLSPAVSRYLTRWLDKARMAKGVNYSGIALKFEHSALINGGVWTIEEVHTISFTSFVSNVGGALGLFIGGTMMSFVQIIMFGVRYCMERRRVEKNVEPN